MIELSKQSYFSGMGGGGGGGSINTRELEFTNQLHMRPYKRLAYI